MRILITSLAALAAAAPAAAQTSAGGALPGPVEQALAAIEARMEPAQRWAFTRTTTAKGATVVERYDPRRPPEQAWLRLSPAPADGELHAPAAAPEDLAVLMEGDGVCNLRAELAGEIAPAGEAGAYAFTPPRPVQLCPDQTGKVDQLLAAVIDHSAGDLTVSADPPGLVSVHFRAEKPFTVQTVVRFEEFDATAYYGEVAPGGPIGRVRAQTRVATRFLFTRNVDEKEEVFSDFERVDVPSQSETTAESAQE